jgi:DNA-binding MarR family transcriptional regulator
MSESKPVTPVHEPAPADFYTPEVLAQGNSLGYLVKRVMNSFLLQTDRRLLPLDLTHAQWLPLYALAKGRCQTTAALARELALDPGAMTRALDRLEAKGLIVRERSAQDRRVVDLQLTDSGRVLAAQVPPVLCEVLNAHLSGFSEAEWQQLIGLLMRLVANADRLREDVREDGGPVPPVVADVACMSPAADRSPET